MGIISVQFLNIYEQQSTFNPNMPLHMLMYAGRLYDKHIHMNRRNIYSEMLIPLPVPKLVVFYNGEDEKEDTVLRLSDSFRAGITAAPVTGTEADNGMPEACDIEVRVRMLNINHGHNSQLMENCRPLAEYAWFISCIRQNSRSMDISDAVDHAIDSMPDGYLIKEFLLGNKAEVKNMCITEYNEAETIQLIREESEEKGHREGRREGENMLGKLMQLLLAEGLTQDAARAASDEHARADLYKKYGIS